MLLSHLFIYAIHMLIIIIFFVLLDDIDLEILRVVADLTLGIIAILKTGNVLKYLCFVSYDILLYGI